LARLIAVRTPLRVSFFGGATDFPSYYRRFGALVLAASLDQYIDVLVRDRFAREIVLNYTRKEYADSVAQVQHALIRESMVKAGAAAGDMLWHSTEVTTLADIPSEGTGLGSSASVTVGALHALCRFKGVAPGPGYLAETACNIEIDVLGRPSGIQDQYMAAHGGVRVISMDADGVEVSEPLDPGDLCNYLLLVYTGVTRPSSLILGAYTDSIDAQLDRLHQLKAITHAGISAFVMRDWERFGHLLHESWVLKQQTANVSNPDIDYLYQRALSLGVWGGKICGAGGGGFMLLCGPPYALLEARNLLGLRVLPFAFENAGSRAILEI